MAKTLTITITDDAKALEIRDTIIEYFVEPKYEDTIEDPDWVYDPDNPDLPGQVPNPVSRDEFFRSHVIDTIKKQYARAKRSMINSLPLSAIENEDLTIG
jgi:hypothetical protein